MQTIKGLIALLLVAATVFTAVMIFNSKMESANEAKATATQNASAITGKTVKQAAVGKTSATDAHQKDQKTGI